MIFQDKIKLNLNLKKVLIIAISFFIAIQVIISIVVCEDFLNVESFSGSDRAKEIVSIPISKADDISWLKGKSTEVKLDSTDKTALEIKNNSTSHSYIVIFHSLTTKPEDTASYARHFYELGFNVLIPYYMPETVSMGAEGKSSIYEWVSFVVKTDEQAIVYIFGMGVGGSSAILATKNDFSESVKGIICDSAYSDVKDVFKENISKLYGVLPFPTVEFASAYAKLVHNCGVSQVDVISSARNSSVPILYIHGTEDSVVPVGQSNELYEVTRAKGTEHETIHGANHLQGLNTNSEKYWRVVDEFIRNTID